MTILITEPPVGTVPHRAIHNRFHLDTGGLAIHFLLDDRRIGPMGLTILQAMGKDLRVTGGRTIRNEEHVRYAPIWAQAHRLQTAAVLDGQRLTAAMVRHLRALLTDSPEIVAVCESGTARRTNRLLNRDGATATLLDWDAFLAAHPTHEPPSDSEPDNPYRMEHLPSVDFLVFRHTARLANTPDVFHAIDADYTAAYRAAKTLTPSLDAVLTHLDEITWHANSTAPILVAIRATQAALFRRGWLLRARADLLLGTLSTVRHPRPTARDWLALRAYTRPERSATTALYLLGVPATELVDITVVEVERSLQQSLLRDQPIPDLARPLLAAQLLRRRAEGAGEASAYLDLPPGNRRRHMEMIIDARRDLDLPIDGRRIRTDNSTQPARPTTHRTRIINTLGLDLGLLT